MQIRRPYFGASSISYQLMVIGYWLLVIGFPVVDLYLGNNGVGCVEV